MVYSVSVRNLKCLASPSQNLGSGSRNVNDSHVILATLPLGILASACFFSEHSVFMYIQSNMNYERRPCPCRRLRRGIRQYGTYNMRNGCGAAGKFVSNVVVRFDLRTCSSIGRRGCHCFRLH